MLLIATHEDRFVGVRDQACLAVATALLRAHPVFSFFARLCTNVGEAVAVNFPRTSLTGHKMNGVIHHLGGLILHHDSNMRLVRIHIGVIVI